ncbi:MAG: protein-L-isoaspartate O-methyltransferase [Sphingomonas bacterium]|nr:protein-L-isoaspartate O-methyltransferase [Sphingomonas bacterium]
MSNHAPHPDHNFDSARRVMVISQLRPQGVTDARVLAAMGAVPREDFVATGQQAMAYGDRPLRLDNGSSMMPPAELGLLLTRLAPIPGERALVVGGGGAYAAAVLRHIALQVDTADAAEAPGSTAYDLILVEGAIEHLPDTLARRLATGGRVGAAIVEDGVTRLATGRGISNSAGGKTVGFTSFAEAQVPILPGFSSAPAFAF